MFLRLYVFLSLKEFYRYIWDIYKRVDYLVFLVCLYFCMWLGLVKDLVGGINVMERVYVVVFRSNRLKLFKIYIFLK